MKVSNFVLGSLVTCAGHSWAFPVEETSVTQLETRQDPVTSVVEVAIGVYAIFAGATAAKVVLKGVANAFKATFGGQKAPYEEKGNCLIEFHTQGGSNCYAKTTPASSSGNSSSDGNVHDENWNVCPWINPSSTAPPIQHFNDPGIGHYSIQFTATREVAWADPNVKDTKKCVAQGLCNPRLTFYRNGYNIVLDTWRSFGRTSSGLPNGLCKAGDDEVQSQLQKGGDRLGDTCAIPCWNQGGLPKKGGD